MKTEICAQIQDESSCGELLVVIQHGQCSCRRALVACDDKHPNPIFVTVGEVVRFLPFLSVCFSVPTLVADLDAQTTLAKAIQEGRLDEVEKVGARLPDKMG